MLDFECKRCRNTILVEYENIGDVVKCPNCESAEIVPDIPFPSGYEYAGYFIEGIAESDQLWTCYRAKSILTPSACVLLKVPTSFFIKHITDFNAFADSVVRNGSFNMPEFPALLDRSIVLDEMFFAYDYIRETHSISFFSKIDFMDSLHIIRNIAVTLKNAWDKNYLLHQDLTPDNIRLTKDKAVRIQNMGLSDSLLKDQQLLDWGFNIWDRRYMSPEFVKEGIADSPSCDIYSLGGILFLMVTGHHPFERVNPVDIYKIPIPEPLQYNHNIPPQIVALYHMMMAKDTNERISSWDIVIENLNSILGVNIKSPAQTQFVERYEKSDNLEPQHESEHFASAAKKKKVFHKNKKKEKPHKRLVFNSDTTLIKLSKVHSKWKNRK
jgi:serine/threonine protein kinase